MKRATECLLSLFVLGASRDLGEVLRAETLSFRAFLVFVAKAENPYRFGLDLTQFSAE